MPRSLGGPSTFDNLVLCHPGCNRHLADRPREQKERMRAKRLGLSLAPQTKPVRKLASANGPKVAAPVKRKVDERTRFWLMAIVAIFFAGLSLGQWIG